MGYDINSISYENLYVKSSEGKKTNGKKSTESKKDEPLFIMGQSEEELTAAVKTTKNERKEELKSIYKQRREERASNGLTYLDAQAMIKAIHSRYIYLDTYTKDTNPEAYYDSVWSDADKVNYKLAMDAMKELEQKFPGIAGEAFDNIFDEGSWSKEVEQLAEEKYGAYSKEERKNILGAAKFGI